MKNQIELCEKDFIIMRLWQYSRSYSQLLIDCEELIVIGKGRASIELLFNTMEHLLKSVACDYDSPFNKVAKKLYDNQKLTDVEFDFVSDGNTSLRKIRNKFAHANLDYINIAFKNDKSDIYPLTEETTCIKLYNTISPIIFNLFLKLVDNSYATINLQAEIISLGLELIELTLEQLALYKGFPAKFIEELDGPIEEKVRLIGNSSDINMVAMIAQKLK